MVSKDALDTAGAGHPQSVEEESVDEESVDEESEESFPASDPPSRWAGGGAVTEDPHHGNVSERVVDRSPVDHVPERRNPDDPVPRTLPRD